MKILQVRNVHEALPRGLKLLWDEGYVRQSRNGLVQIINEPVTTVYERPWERVMYWPVRDANPFFHFVESLWMLAGRNDVELPARYASNIRNYSDDGITMHGAYGYRWRQHFHKDQLKIVIDRLSSDMNDRRSVIQMWDAGVDLGVEGRDFPCNLIATVQINRSSQLDLTVFCRSNDIVWGSYGANAVHFSFLQEYLARKIGVDMGTYTQISVNYHGYLNTIEPLKGLIPDKAGYISNPYAMNEVVHLPIPFDADFIIKELLTHEASRFNLPRTYASFSDDPWTEMAYAMLRAHTAWRSYEDESRYIVPLQILSTVNKSIDWIKASMEWIERRYKQKYGVNMHATAT